MRKSLGNQSSPPGYWAPVSTYFTSDSTVQAANTDSSAEATAQDRRAGESQGVGLNETHTVCICFSGLCVKMDS